MRSYADQWNVWEALDADQQKAVKDVRNLSVELRGRVDAKVIERLARAACDLGWVDDDFADEDEEG
jgi:hypothetical protein